ncbi:MAG: large protein [Verrucomicrobiales bacterium]|nr:large protein [Verrucomicrobiales bacterium]
MRRLRLLLTALTLAFTWNAHALSISIDANLLKDANGNAMPTTGLVMLVASTNDATFNGPTPLNFVSGDDVIIAKWDLSSANGGGFDTAGVLSAFVNTTVAISSTSPLRLYWYPTLNFNSTAPGQNTPYGTYTDAVGVDGSAKWFGDTPSATITLRFLTTDANTGFDNAGSNPPATGIANQVTPTPIVINTQPVSSTQNLGATANFSVSATGTSLVYQWRKNGGNLANTGNVSGATTANLTLSSVSATDVASYSVVITNSQGFLTSSSATLSVNDPFISSQPASTTVNATGTANFSVSANGTGTITYQWKKAGSPLSNGAQGSGAVVSGATTSTVTISGVQQSDAAAYTVVVTATGGSVTSSPAGLTVTDIAAVFSSPPTDSTSNVSAGDSTVLTAASTGTTPITYQWKKGLSNLADGTYANGATISGATTGSLTLTGVFASDAGVYACNAHNSVGDTLSHTTTINVADPIITAQPTSFTAQCGDIFPCLSVTALGSTNLTYQWYTPNPAGTAVSGATNATLCFNSNSFASAGSYSVVVSNVYGNSITSSVATVTVTDTIAPDISLNGTTPVNICQGASYTEQGATATDSCDGTLTVTSSGSVDANTVGAYTITYNATDSHGNVGTEYRVVNVQICGPTISIQPQSQTINAGTTLSLSVTATPNTSTYQWKKDGLTIANATNSTYSKSGVLDIDAGAYTVDVTAGTTTPSDAANISIIDPAINVQPLAQIVIPGQKLVTLSVGAAGTGTLHYQWFKQGVAIARQTNSSTVLPTITPTSGATYYCVVTGTLGSKESSHVAITVAYPPQVSVQPANVKKTAGNIASFKVTASPKQAFDPSLNFGGPVTFQWLKNGSPIFAGGKISIINNSNSSVLMIQNIQLPDAATYQCVLSNLSGRIATSLNTKGILTVDSDIRNPVAVILHPSANLKFTNGLAASVGGGVTQTNIAPQLDIDGRGTDNGLITDMTLLRIVPPNSLSNSLTFVHRTNSAGVMLPGTASWTNRVALLPGTNTFVVSVTDSAGLKNTNNSARTYYFLTNGAVTINAVPSTSGTVSGVATFGIKPVQGANNLPIGIGFKVTAAHKTGKTFNNWTDGNGNIIGTLPTLPFVPTNGSVINANFSP